MGPEPSVEFERVATGFDANGIRWMLIGGQAVRLYGGPRPSYDYDVWVAPEDRVRALRYLQDVLGLELSAEPEDPRPIVKAYGGVDRIDIFGVRSLTNIDGVVITFEDTFARSRVERDEEYRLAVRLPAIDDLIALKRMRIGQPRDAEDIQFLLVRKDLESKGLV